MISARGRAVRELEDGRLRRLRIVRADAGAQPGSAAGLPIAPQDEREIVRHVVSSLEDGVGGGIVTVNVDIFRQAAADPELMRLEIGRASCRERV